MTVAYIFSARVVKVDFNDCTQERAGNRTLFCVCAAVSVCTLSSAGRGAVVGGCIARGKQRQSSETRVGVALFSIPSLPPKFKGHFTKFIQLRGIMQLGIKKQQLCTNSGFIVLHVAIISSLVDIFFFISDHPPLYKQRFYVRETTLLISILGFNHPVRSHIKGNYRRNKSRSP